MKLLLALRAQLGVATSTTLRFGTSRRSDWCLWGCMVPALTIPPAHQPGVANVPWLLPSPRARPRNIPSSFLLPKSRVYLHTLPSRSLPFIFCYLLQLLVALRSFLNHSRHDYSRSAGVSSYLLGRYSSSILSSRSASDPCLYIVAVLVVSDSYSQH
jgi:hypothetical protein